jgi:hypothetical protein
MTGPPPPTEQDANDWVVNGQQLAAISRQLWHLTMWVQFLNTIDWSKVPSKPGGPAGTPPPPPPKWPP